MAGHSAWKNIKHRKAAVDAKRGKLWSKCARAIIVAARSGGGQTETNLTLRYAIDDARAVNMPKATIENAIKKGTGELGAENYESAMYEGYGPGGVAMFIEVLTNNRNRTAGDVRVIFDKYGGNLGAAGSVAYLFNQKGMIRLSKSAADENRLMEIVLDAGAEDVADEGEEWAVVTEQTAYHRVLQALAKANIPTLTAELTMIPANTVACSGETARKVLALIEALEDNEDVQKVHSNFDISQEELAAMDGGR